MQVTNYLHVSSKQKLLREVETEVLEKHQAALLEKEHSGCSALLQDDKVRVHWQGLCLKWSGVDCSQLLLSG